MTVVLVTGFEPFGGETVNPSAVAVRAAEDAAARGRFGPGVAVHAVVLPVELAGALPVLRAAMDATDPALVIGFGQAGGRAGITPERVAVNVEDAAEPDNAGAVLDGGPVLAGGPPAYMSTLPLGACVTALRDAGIPASVSDTAGTYLCNHVFYGLMHDLSASAVRGGFVHVPYAHHQVLDRPGVPSLAQATIDEAVQVVIEACLRA